MPPKCVRVKLTYSHLSENCLLNRDETCESKIVQKFGKKGRDFKYGISYISRQTISLKIPEYFKKARSCRDNINRGKMCTGGNTANALLHSDPSRMTKPDSRKRPRGCTS